MRKSENENDWAGLCCGMVCCGVEIAVYPQGAYSGVLQWVSGESSAQLTRLIDQCAPQQTGDSRKDKLRQYSSNGAKDIHEVQSAIDRRLS